MAKRYDIKRIAEIENREIFVDANVLMYWNWSGTGTDSMQYEIEYSSVYMALIKQKNKLFVDFLVISEVVNRVLRIEHKKQQSEQNFKQFRESEHGKATLLDIYSIIESRILDNFGIAGKSFSKDDIKNYLTVDSLDFMDKGVLAICKENNFVLLTNDKDYKSSGIDILTCNRKILD